ncbi:MAG TPA: hypothetical protein VJ697_13135, partial [Nitrososphaeraceae archaeon]|nr:hypothetical protein [Nitrososphaeraceae archaeon]
YVHKSIIIFFILLVILLPLGTSNMNISNANAIADFDNKEDRKQQVSSLDCSNYNVNVNGLELDVLPPFLADNSGLTTEAAGTVDGNTDPSSVVSGNNGETSEIKDFRVICSSYNDNKNIEAGEEIILPEPPTPPTPPEPPTPTTASLTINKEIFGCNNIITSPFTPPRMNCFRGPDGSDEFPWINCDSPSSFSNPVFCERLPENLFDIRVLGPQNNLIYEDVAPENGITFDNLQPGTYTVEEIKYDTPFNQLEDFAGTEMLCQDEGFADGGILQTNTNVRYVICFLYEDELGNDCSTMTLAAGEQRTCTVKNYIYQGVDFSIR